MGIESLSSFLQQVFAFSGKNFTAALDTNSALWLNTFHAGANQHPGGLDGRLRADSLSLVLLMPAYLPSKSSR
jgi:hypothetical protein